MNGKRAWYLVTATSRKQLMKALSKWQRCQAHVLVSACDVNGGGYACSDGQFQLCRTKCVQIPCCESTTAISFTKRKRSTRKTRHIALKEIFLVVQRRCSAREDTVFRKQRGNVRPYFSLPRFVRVWLQIKERHNCCHPVILPVGRQSVPMRAWQLVQTFFSLLVTLMQRCQIIVQTCDHVHAHDTLSPSLARCL